MFSNQGPCLITFQHSYSLSLMWEWMETKFCDCQLESLRKVWALQCSMYYSLLQHEPYLGSSLDPRPDPWVRVWGITYTRRVKSKLSIGNYQREGNRYPACNSDFHACECGCKSEQVHDSFLSAAHLVYIHELGLGNGLLRLQHTLRTAHITYS